MGRRKIEMEYLTDDRVRKVRRIIHDQHECQFFTRPDPARARQRRQHTLATVQLYNTPH